LMMASYNSSGGSGSTETVRWRRLEGIYRCKALYASQGLLQSNQERRYIGKPISGIACLRPLNYSI
jgi:hypothetical protein